MKKFIVLVAVCCLVLAALPLFAEQDSVYGRKLINLTDEYIDSFKPESERPVPGTKPNEEWEQYNALRGLMSQKSPAWSLDGSFLAFIGSINSIYIVPAEDGVPAKLWDGNAFYEYQGKQYYMNLGGMTRSLCFSPDGTEVFFDSRIIDEERGTVVTLHFNEDGTFSGAGIKNSISVIRAVNITTGETRIVVENAIKPQFSRNGKYFSYRDSRTLELYIREMSTGSEWILERVSILNRCFSGDGNYIISDNGGQFYRVPATGGDKEQISFDITSPLILTRFYPDSSPGDDFVLFDGDAGGRSKTFYDEDGNKIGQYSTSSMQKICVLSVEAGLSFPLVPVEGGAESTGAKFSPDGTKICYTMRDRDIRDSRQEIYIKNFDSDSFMKLTEVGIERPTPLAITGIYPNPFNPSTTIEFSLSDAGFAELVIYNVAGQKIRTLATGTITPGIHSISWNGRDDSGVLASTGIYVTRLRMGDAVTTGRMTLMK